MKVLQAFDVDNEQLAVKLRDLADRIETARASIKRVRTSEIADVDSQAVTETVEIQFHVNTEDGPLRPLSYETDE